MNIGNLLPPPWTLITSLIDISRSEGFQFLVRLQEEYLSGRTLFDKSGEALLGAYDGEQLIGVCGLTVDPYSGDLRVGRVRHLFVHPAWRRRGVGRVLVTAIEERAHESFNTLVLRTDTESAAAFYRTLGYERMAALGTATHRRELIASPSL
jgi:GNAT superfamily N-acetyltransferase